MCKIHKYKNAVGWECSSAAECLLSLWKALCLNFSAAEMEISVQTGSGSRLFFVFLLVEVGNYLLLTMCGEVREQAVVISSLLLRGFPGSNSGSEAWWQASSPAEPGNWSSLFVPLQKYRLPRFPTEAALLRCTRVLPC